jgi:hypothetical protein
MWHVLKYGRQRISKRGAYQVVVDSMNGQVDDSPVCVKSCKMLLYIELAIAKITIPKPDFCQ